MAYVIDCLQVSVQRDEFCTIVAFTDDPVGMTRYVMIQCAHAYEEQDRNLGMDGPYLELDDQIKSVYRGIAEIRFGSETLELVLTEKARKALKLDGDILLRLNTEIAGSSDAIAELRKIARANRIAIGGA